MLTTFSSEGSFTCHTYCDMGPPFLRSCPKDRWFSLLNAVLYAKEQSLLILNVLSFTRLARAGLELTTSHLLSEGTTTRLRHVWKISFFITGCWTYLFLRNYSTCSVQGTSQFLLGSFIHMTRRKYVSIIWWAIDQDCTGHDVGKSPYRRCLWAYYVQSVVLLFLFFRNLRYFIK
jgi:hypothetical protein